MPKPTSTSAITGDQQRGPVRPVHLSVSRAVRADTRIQVIRVGARDTRFEGWCEHCLDEATPQSIGVRWLRVEGELPEGIDAAVTSCRRGHRIAVRRLRAVAADAAA